MGRFGATIGLALLIGLGAARAQAASAPPLLLQHPSMSASEIAFDYAGEIWIAPRDGGPARLLAAGQGQNSRPIFSPDGRWIAFTGRYDGNTDVYVVPAAGGEPRRLTWHPGADIALGWTPDSKSVLFRSGRRSPRDLDQLWTVSVDGGPAAELPLPSGDQASFSPDGTHLAYTPFSQWQPAWKHYRGGQTARIWIADLSDSHVVKVPRDNSNDRNPIWVGDKVYFLSDRDGPIALYAYDVKTNAVTPVVENPKGLDIASASAGPGGIVFDQFGALRIYDFASGKVRTVPVTVSAELPEVRARFEALRADDIEHAALSPTGKRVLIEAHGEILSAPAEKGDVRNLTQSPGVADRDPAASPDGKQVAWFSDESGEYALHIRSADGLGPVRKIGLGSPPSYFYGPKWSPDSKKVLFHDKRLNLWMVDLDKGKPEHVDTDLFDSPSFNFAASWAPDSRWITYTKQLANHLHAVWVYSLETGKATQLTDGRSDATSPRFDHSGDYLYFTASTNEGPGAGWLDMSSLGRPVDAAVYVMVLRKDLPSPVAPESDEEASKAAEKAKDVAAKPGDADEGEAKAKKPAPKGKAAEKDVAPASNKLVRIDFDHIDQRILALPMERRNYTGLETGKDGVLYATSAATALSDDVLLELDQPPRVSITRFDLKTRKEETLTSWVVDGSFSVSADGSKLLYQKAEGLFVVDADKAPKAGEGALKLSDVGVWIDPPQEWRQMYREAWRIERDFLYDPKLQGLNYDAATKFYARYLDGLGGRADLNTLFEEMTGHIGVGHTFIRGGDLPHQKPVRVGLLGADFAPVDGRWKITRILRGENWNPKLTAPLSQPGVNVAEGEFVLAVNGRDIRTDAEIYRYFEGLAGKQTVLTVGPKADGTGSRQVTVVPIASEGSLRLRTWMEDNRRKVDELSGGKIAYVYLPDTALGGFANFNRYYFSQVGKQGVILDERFNHGGDIADYIVDQLKRTPQMINETREGGAVVEPAQAIFGPKVMIINQMSGSGGDALPWLFKKAGVGQLVGVRTWGGLVGIGGYPNLIDGGSITAPRWAIYGTKGQWEVENIGIAPDVEVEQDPALVRKGHDPQLEAAVKSALEQLAANPQPTFVAPAAPDRHPVIPTPDDQH